ncbi:diacylglycerol acyltransferase-domain-containing protein, partial [Ephemerocybe angulata]
TSIVVLLRHPILLVTGMCSVNRASRSNELKSGPGAITIVVGSVKKDLSGHPGTTDFALRKRLEFIKLPIQHEAELVPVVSFGENDIYQQMPNEKGTDDCVCAGEEISGEFWGLPCRRNRLNYGLSPALRVSRPARVEAKHAQTP